ncbi:MAG: DUF2062 domain-containing protein [Terracidiphilus sp.]|nr:DUF2062 domain-containing protein [Terracidiphilus sp.]
MRKWLTNRRQQVAAWLCMGVSPRRLALTLALGFAIGCLPVVGITTALCALVALALRLNLPAIQAANYVAMPLQLVLIVPFVRMGRWMFSSDAQQSLQTTLFHGFSIETLRASGSVAGQALGAWLVLATPAVLLMTVGLTVVLRRVPAIATAQGE